MTRISIREDQFIDIENSSFTDVHKHFMLGSDLLFVTKDSDVIGVIAYENFSKAYDEKGMDVDLESIIDTKFTYLYEDQLEQAEDIFKKTYLRSIPILDKNGNPKFVLRYSKYDINQSFYCCSLSGSSTYNFSINADLTVSCHCSLRETGQLGFIGKNEESTITDAFNSARANELRENLSNGWLHTSHCLWCPDLVPAPKSICKMYIANFTFPKSVMIEGSSVCNLKCKDCITLGIENAIISNEDFEMIVKQLSLLDINTIYFFKHGEPFSDKNIDDKMTILRQYLSEVFVLVSTNGVLLDKPSSVHAALKMNKVVVSLDGIDDTDVVKYQVGSSFTRVYENMKNLICQRDAQDNPILKMLR